MATVALALDERAIRVASLGLKQNCDLFASGAAPSRYCVQSDVTLDLFSLFLEAVSGKDIQITNENVSDLSQLCKEFGFRNLSSKLSDIRDSASLPLVSAGTLSEVPVCRSVSGPVSALRSAIPCCTFLFLINGRHMASDLVEAVILSPAVHEQLLIDSCARTFIVCNDEVNSADFSSLQKLVSGNEIVIRQSSQKSLVLLSRLLFNTALERFFFGL
jgi:hypothetical protein